jgi:hypothetical protein
MTTNQFIRLREQDLEKFSVGETCVAKFHDIEGKVFRSQVPPYITFVFRFDGGVENTIWFSFREASQKLWFEAVSSKFNEGDLVYCSLIDDITTVSGAVVKTPLVVVGKSYLNNGWAYKLSSSNRVLYPENSLTKVCS